MADTESSHSLGTSDMNSIYPGDVTQSRDGHMIFSSGAIKQENGGLLGKSSCTGPGLLGNLSNGYALGLPASAKDPTWAFKDTLLYNGQHQQDRPSSLLSAGVTMSYPGVLPYMDRTSPIQSYGSSGNLDWGAVPQSSSVVSRSTHYYPSSLSAHPAGGYSPYAGWDSAPQATYSPYNMPSSHTYRQADTTGSCGYSPYPSSVSSSYSNGLGPIKSELTSPPTIQDMDQERSIRRARRNRTCFSKYQLERLEEVFRESKYPDVYRREEIAAQLDIKEEVVRVWFKNRRAKLKRDVKDHKTTGNGSRASGDSGSPRSTGSSVTAQSTGPKEARSSITPYPVSLYSPSLPYTPNGGLSSISGGAQKNLPKITLPQTHIPSTVSTYGSTGTGLSSHRENLHRPSELNTTSMSTTAFRNMMSSYNYNSINDLNQPTSAMTSNEAINILPGGVTVTQNEADVTAITASPSAVSHNSLHDVMVSQSPRNLPREHIAQSAFSAPHFKSKSFEEHCNASNNEHQISIGPTATHVQDDHMTPTDGHLLGNETHNIGSRSHMTENEYHMTNLENHAGSPHEDFEELGPDDLSGEDSAFESDA